MATIRNRTLMLLSVFWAATWVSAPVFATAAEEKRVLILGDSLTKGFGVDPDDAFPALLQEKMDAAGYSNYLVLNGGVSGDTSAGGLRRMGWLFKKRVDVMVIALGGNDGLRGVDPAATEKNLQEIIDKARKANPKIRLLLAGMEMPDNMGKDYVEAFRKVFPRIAKKNEIALVPVLLKGVEGDAKLNQPDMIHPNEAGHKILAATVWSGLEPLLKDAKKVPEPAG